MVNSLNIQQHKSKLPVRIASVLFLTSIFSFVMYIAAKAMWIPFSHDDFPESLAIKVELLPVIFPIHMITGALALILLPAAYMLRHTNRFHKLIGRIAAADVLVSGITAFPVALVAPVTRLSAAGFTVQAALWILFLGLGIYSIRLRRVAAHRAYMLMMAATTSGAVFFRVYLALWAIYGNMRYFEAFYIFDAWIAWALPLTLCATALRRHNLFQNEMRDGQR